jgi:hypothetical protein
MALPSLCDWNSPAGTGLPPFGMVHISYIFPDGAGGRLDAISRTPWVGFKNTRPRGGLGCAVPKFTSFESAPLRIANASV